MHVRGKVLAGLLILSCIGVASNREARADGISPEVQEVQEGVINEVISCGQLGKRLTPEEFQQAISLASDAQKTTLQKLQADQAKLAPLPLDFNDPQNEWDRFHGEVSTLIAQYREQAAIGETMLDRWQAVIDQIKASKDYSSAENLKKNWNWFVPIHDYVYMPEVKRLADQFSKSYYDFFSWSAVNTLMDAFGSADPVNGLSQYMECGLEPGVPNSWVDWAKSKFEALPKIPEGLAANDFKAVFPGDHPPDIGPYLKGCHDRTGWLPTNNGYFLCMIDQMDQVVIPELRAQFKKSDAELLGEIDPIAQEVSAQKTAP